jgi:hypothetical protein
LGALPATNFAAGHGAHGEERRLRCEHTRLQRAVFSLHGPLYWVSVRHCDHRKPCITETIADSTSDTFSTIAGNTVGPEQKHFIETQLFDEVKAANMGSDERLLDCLQLRGSAGYVSQRMTRTQGARLP